MPAGASQRVSGRRGHGPQTSRSAHDPSGHAATSPLRGEEGVSHARLHHPPHRLPGARAARADGGGLHLRRDAARQHHRHAGRHRRQQRSRGPQDPREGVRARSAGLRPLRQVAVPRRAGRLRQVAGDAPAGLGRAAVGHPGHGLSRGRGHLALDADRRAARHDRRRPAQHADRLHRAGHVADRHLDPRVLVRHPLRAVLLALSRLAALVGLRQPVRGLLGAA